MDLYLGMSMTGNPATFTAIIPSPHNANLVLEDAANLLLGECRFRKLPRPRIMLSQYQWSQETDEPSWVLVGCFEK